jgi:hypothetical protein
MGPLPESLATGLYTFLNGGWPQWVGNLANVAQLLGLVLPALAFLAGRWSRPRPLLATAEPAHRHHRGWRPLCPRHDGTWQGLISTPVRSGRPAVAGRRARLARAGPAARPASPPIASVAAGPAEQDPAQRRGGSGAAASPACSGDGSPPGHLERGVRFGTDASPPALSGWIEWSRTRLERPVLQVVRDAPARRAGRARLAPAPPSMARPAASRRTAGRLPAAVDGRSAADRRRRGRPRSDRQRGPPGR